MKIRRSIGHVGGQGASGRNRIAQFTNPATGDAPSEMRRYESREGITRRTPPATLNATEVRVSAVLDAEFVSAQEIAGFAGVSVHACRRALGTLREKGIADAERRGNVHAWRRA